MRGGASMDPILERLNGVSSYHPFEADTFADWTMEAGDMVTVSREGTAYHSPVSTMRMVWRGKPEVTIESGGSRKREPISRMSARKYARGGSAVRNSQAIYYDIHDESGHLHTVLEATESHVMAEVENRYTQMKSGLAMTSSAAALYVDNKYTQMTAGLGLTSSSAALYVDNRYNQMKAGLNLTSSSAALYVDNRYNQMKAGLNLTSSSAALYVDNKYTQMTAGLKLSESSARLYVDNKYTQMTSGLKLSESSARLYVDNKYNQMKSGLNLTSSSAALYVDNKYTQMTAGLKLSESSARLYVDNKYNEMKAGLGLTSSSAALYVDNKYTQMTAGLKLSESSARLYVDNKYNEMKAGLNLSSSSAALYVTNKYNEMKAGLGLTSSSAALYVDNKYNQMKAGLNLTSSSAALYVDNKYNQMKTGLNLTSSSAALYVDNKYNQMKAGLGLTTSTAVLYAGSADNAAKIVAKINASTGTSEIKLDAAHVYIGNDKSTTIINGKLNASDVTSDYLATKIANISIVTVNALSVTGGTSLGGTLTVSGRTNLTGGLAFSNSVGATVFTDCVVNASVSNNTLTLTKASGGTVTFSKATSLSGEWSSGHVTITASPQNEKYERWLSAGNKQNADGSTYTEGNKTWVVPIYVKTSQDDPSTSVVAYKVPVNATSIHTKGMNDARDAIYRAPVTLSGNVVYNASDRKYYQSGSATVQFANTLEDKTGVDCYGGVVVNDAVGYGMSLVTLNDPVWDYDGDNVDSNNRNQNTVRVSTSGRSTNLTKAATIYLDVSSGWNNGTKPIYVRQSGSSGEFLAKGTVTDSVTSVTANIPGSTPGRYIRLDASTASGATGTGALYLTQSGATVYATKNDYYGESGAVTVGQCSISGYRTTAHSNCVAGLSRAYYAGYLIHGVLYTKSGSTYYPVVTTDQYWYYTSSNSTPTTYYS